MTADVIQLRPTAHEDLPDGTVNGAQLATLTGLTYRRIDHWTRAGYLHPADQSPGSGYQRVYPTSEIAVARLIGQLVDDGLLPNHAAAHARDLLTNGTTRIAGITIHLPEEL